MPGVSEPICETPCLDDHEDRYWVGVEGYLSDLQRIVV
jgi:hypothetical protein